MATAATPGSRVSRLAVPWARGRHLVARYWLALALIVVLVMAVWARLYRLDTVPGNLTADETDFFQEVYRVLEGHGRGWFFQGQPASLAPLGIYPMAWSVRLFGDSVFGLRMYSVLLSLATLVPFFLLVRHRFGPLVALTVTLLLSTNLWFLHFSRTAWANMNAALIATGVTSTLLLGLEKGRWWWFAAAGVFTGLAPWGYVSARVLPLVAAAFFPVALFVYRRQWWRVVWGFALAGVVALLIAAPLLKELRQGLWGDYTGRARTVSIFEGRSSAEAWDLVPDKIRDTFRGFILLSNADNIFRTSTEAVRYAPQDSDLFDPVTRVLFFLGLIVGVWRWRSTALWWLMLLAPLPIQVFTVGTPDAARGLLLVPTIFLFVALGLDTVLAGARRLVADRTWALAAGAAVVLAGAGVVSALNVRSYFRWMESDYALADRHPAVWTDEFEEWSSYQREAAAQGIGGFNTGTWRERQDRAGCLTGRVVGGICSHLPLSADPDPLGSTLVRPAEVPQGLVQRLLAAVAPDEFRRLHGSRSDPLAETLKRVEIEAAWATVFTDGGVALTASAARLGSVAQAELVVSKKGSLTGADYLGGPQAEELAAPPLGDGAVLYHYWLGGEEWWEYFWRDGPYIGQVQVLYTGLPAAELRPFPMLERAALAQAQRLAALAAQ